MVQEKISGILGRESFPKSIEFSRASQAEISNDASVNCPSDEGVTGNVQSRLFCSMNCFKAEV